MKTCQQEHNTLAAGMMIPNSMFLLNNRYASILFGTCADKSFISIAFSSLIDIVPTPLGNRYDVELANGKIIRVDTIMRGCTLNFLSHPFNIDLMPVELGSFDVIIGIDWLRRCHAVIVCDEKLIFLAQISAKKEEDRSEGKQLKDVPIVRDYPEVFLKDLSGLPSARPCLFENRLEIRLSPAERARTRRSKNSIQNSVWALRVLGHAIRTDKRTCGNEGVVGLTRWIEKMESVFQISGRAIENQFVADETEKIDKYVNGLPDNIYGSVKASKPKTLDETIELTNDLMDQKLRTYAESQTNNKRKADDSFRNNPSHQQQTPKRKNVTKVHNIGTGERKPYSGNLPKCTKCHFHHNSPYTQKCNKVRNFARDCRSSRNANVTNAQRNNGANPKGNGCFEYGATGHFKRDCPKLKNKDGGKENELGWVYAVRNAEKRGNASREPDSNVVTGTFLLNNRYESILFDTGVDRSFISTVFSSLIDIVPTPLGNSYDVELADGKIVGVDTIMR
nr:hypothetical protein [Tanacetum cinerariifolium]